jgi:hypothetical protein
MADPVSLALGIAPLIGGTFKVYQVVYRKAQVFGRADREVDRLRKSLSRGRNVFINEMHLLLRLVIEDEEQIEAMVSDADHARWTSPGLECLLKRRLARSYESFLDIVDDIRTNTAYLLQEIERFETQPHGTADQPSKLKETMSSLRSAAKVAVDKSKCDKAVESLRVANGDLRRLLNQALELGPKKQRSRNDGRPDTVSKHRPSYASCAKIRRATRALHEGLSKTLPGQQHHDVRLFLEATMVDDNTITDLAILCASQNAMSRTLVQVRSRPIEWLETPQRVPAPEARRKRRRVRWTDEQAGPEPQQPLDPEEAEPQTEEHRLAENLCLEICQGTGCHDERRTKDCLCYVETRLDQTFRHEFYSHGSQMHRPTELATFDDILRHPVATSISVVDQLRLARTIVSAVLYFSSTPWLAEYWGMKDLCFFLDHNDLQTSLRTLNLGVRFLGTDGAQLESTMEGVDGSDVGKEPSPAAVDETMLVYGIRNLTLHSLGVVLLQIGRWNRVDPSDIVQVRRLAQEVPRIGPKYRDLMQKCLNCDFGCGSNLARPQLQQAVYEDVVEELDAMIRSLDSSDDDGTS